MKNCTDGVNIEMAIYSFKYMPHLVLVEVIVVVVIIVVVVVIV